jgi:DNA-binding transcriptional ArsR family regulator
MESSKATEALAALAHEGRLAIFRLLVAKGPAGLTVGEIARKLKIPGATLSFHLSQLKHGGLVTARRDGRTLIQTANFSGMNQLIAYLTENCCGGEMQCGPICKPTSTPRRAASKAG